MVGANMRNQGLLLIAGVLVLLDQCTKLWIKGFNVLGVQHRGMYIGESYPLLGDLVRITFIENPGMAFGIEFGAGKVLLSLFSIAMAGLLAWYLATTDIHHRWARIGLMLVFAGATGNLIDRVFYGVLYGESPIMYGKVVDFIDVDIIDIVLSGERMQRFWIFNVADACVSTGIVLLILVGQHVPFLQNLHKDSADEQPHNATDISSGKYATSSTSADAQLLQTDPVKDSTSKTGL
jgi:signal peptidase II